MPCRQQSASCLEAPADSVEHAEARQLEIRNDMDSEGEVTEACVASKAVLGTKTISRLAIPTNRAIELMGWHFAVGMGTPCQLIDTSYPALNISATLHDLILS
jgi:hypothetical protein